MEQPGRIDGATRTLGIIGWPVTHSLSPTIHNAAFAALGLDWVFVPLPVAPGEARGALVGLRALGFSGANVTMPHKTEVAEAVDSLADDARRLRAVNTLVVGADGIDGHNTDAPGFERFLRRDAGFDPAGRTAMIYGAGGAARITVVARDLASTPALRQACHGLPVELVMVGFDEAPGHPADLLVNATPLGMDGEVLPLPDVSGETMVVDLLYHPAVTPLQTAAKAQGATVFGGLGLLLHQAALSFGLWTGQPAPLDVMSAAAVAALAERT